ncbi:putative GABA permease [Lindgomyces ingoldianus]|uniref:GABA permease n=1 Tax=Lindgomyces ingoldianus TaxID=673940 RepID=A0ACB6QDU4_9PLEO|nr:putative GABA permease [Lindgomyces ingoldianus]KAF2465154.1 putative GABA permease [Lindgomyces ingoldianus]
MADPGEYRLETMTTQKTSVQAQANAVVVEDLSSKMNDEQILAHFGKRQQFKRNFGLISILGLGCTLMLTWEGSVANLLPPLINGGPTGAIAAFPVVMFGVFLQILVMAEMASMIPLSGGQYNWVAILAPQSCSNFLSYTTGWITAIAWQAAAASATWIDATLLLTIVSVNYPSYNMQMWHAVLIFYAIIALAVFVTTYLGRIFPSLEAMVLVLHIVGFFAILIVLVYLAPKTPSDVVFHTVINGGGFKTNAESILVGAVILMYNFNGVDAATHMAEEIENAAVVIPRAMILTVFINGFTGFAMLIALIFCMGPLEEILTSTFPYPFILILGSITNSMSGTTVLAAIILVMGISASIGLIATASRMLWAFSRENGVPFSRYVSRIEPRTALPIYSIAITALISLLLALIPLGSTTAFYALTGLTVAGFYSSFMVSASVMLWRRLTTPSANIAWGPFRLGKMGVPITIVALIYSFIGWIFSFWPPVAAVTIHTFNWSLVVYFGVVILSMAYYGLRARKTYTGPKVEIENVVHEDGKE